MRLLACLLCLLPCTISAQSIANELELSVALEARSGLDRAVGYLISRQAEDGSWSDHAGITSACVLALRNSPLAARDDLVAAMARACDYIVGQLREDGSISRVPGDLDVYSTSVALMALSSMPGDAYAEPVERLTERLLQSQLPTGHSYDSRGFRYATSTYPDLSNTHWALEALHIATASAGDELPQARRNKLGKLWRVSQALILDCQVTAETEGMPEGARGGFTYYPIGKEVAEPRHEELLDHSPVWGSLTYGATKSLLYAGMKPDAAQLRAAREWLARHYTVANNPGLDNGGLYYYYYMLASTHTLLGETIIETPQGREHDWRHDLVNQLLSRQKGQGQWTNSRQLWMEDNAYLCTAYAMLALELVLGR